MKRTIVFLMTAAMVVMLGVSSAGASGFGLPALIPKDDNGKPAAVSPEILNTLLDAVSETDTAGGSTFDLGFSAKTITWVVSKTSGTAPTNVVVQLLGSIDGTVWSVIDSETYTGTVLADATYGNGKTRYVTTKPVRYLKAMYTSRTGGDSTTKITVKALAIH